MRYAVIIPVFNEAALFPRLLERLLVTPPVGTTSGSGGEIGALGAGGVERHIIVIDDGSTDGTRALVEALRNRTSEQGGVIHPILQPVNRGKGAAVRAGFDAALALGADIVVIQDADLEYDPRDHAKLLEPIIDGRADAVFGSRFLGDTHRVLYFWHAVANWFITTCSNMLTNLNLTDIECCLKAFTRPVIEQIRIQEDRFGVEPELVAKVARLRLNNRSARVYEVGVSYAGRTYEEGKKITWRDGVSALRCIVKYARC